jgi:hypothetical protein
MLDPANYFTYKGEKTWQRKIKTTKKAVRAVARVAANQVRSDPAAAGKVAARKAARKAAAEVPRVAGGAALEAETANITCLLT